MLQAFQASHSRLRLELRELSSVKQLAELARDRLDVGFARTALVPLPESAQSIALAQLAGEVSPDYHDRILALCAQVGWAPQVRHELRHWLSVVSLMSQGMGVALVPGALQRFRLAGAVFVPLVQATPPYDTRCLWRTQCEVGTHTRSWWRFWMRCEGM